MDYDCLIVPLDKILLSPKGVIEPMCNSCSCEDCTNPIRKVKVSIQGITKVYRLFQRGTEYRAVIQCDKGYINEALWDIDEDE